MHPRRRLAVAVSILISVFAYLVLRLIFPLLPTPLDRGGGALLLFAAFGLVLWLPLYFWNRDEEEIPPLLQALSYVCFFSMALLSFLFTFTVVKDLLWLFSLCRWDWINSQGGAEAILLFAAAGMSAGILNAFFGLKTVQKEIAFKNLPASLDGLTIAQISDLHIGNTVQTPYVDRVIQKVNALNPDLIVLTGDIVDGMVSQLRSRFELLAKLHAKLGRFYVTGNHEYYWEGEGWIKEARRIGLTALDNQNTPIKIGNEQISLCGVSDLNPDFSKALAGTEKSALKILLCHQPHHADEAHKFGFDLQLSGHTHGGQFFPWNWVIHFIQPYVKGLYRVGEMWLYINRGTGHWGPPVRLGTAPEITFIRITRT